VDWKQVKIYTTSEGIEPVSALLESCSVQSYELADANDFRDFMADTEIYWDYLDEDLVKQKCNQETCFTFYLTQDDEGRRRLAEVESGLGALKARDVESKWGRLCIETAITHQEDWEWGWKQYFKPFTVGDNFIIKPSWENVDDAGGRRVLEIDPASSFGTGSHATTQLCITELEREVTPGVRMLDMGTGSGILAIAAAMLGAEVDAVVDIDSGCLRTAKENAEKNHVHIKRTLCGDALRDPALKNEIGCGYGLITANIVADVIISMAPMFLQALNTNGVLICSGIIDERAAEVCNALAQQGFSLIRKQSREGWSAFTLVKRAENLP